MFIHGEIKYFFFLTNVDQLVEVLDAIHKDASAASPIKSEKIKMESGMIRLEVKVLMVPPGDTMASAVKTFPSLKEILSYMPQEGNKPC